MAGLRDALVVNTKDDSPLNANAAGVASGTEVSNFVTAQSLSTFAVAAVALKTLWELIQGLTDAGWADSYWTPFVLCVVYGIWQFTISIVGENRVKGFGNVLSLVFVTLVNAGILTASIIGLTDATNVGEE